MPSAEVPCQGRDALGILQVQVRQEGGETFCPQRLDGRLASLVITGGEVDMGLWAQPPAQGANHGQPEALVGPSDHRYRGVHADFLLVCWQLDNYGTYRIETIS